MLSQAKRYLAAGWRHRGKALLVAWVVCLVGWVGVHLLPDRYRSNARVYADADVILGQTLRGIAVDGATAAQVDILQRTLLSRPNLERVVASTDLDQRVTDPASREELLKLLARNIRIQPQTRNLFQIEYNDTDPKLAQAVVQAVLNLFVENATGNDRQQMENARSFIAQQITTYEGQLREAEQRRADFRTRYVDLLPNDSLGGASRLEAARSRLAQFRGQLEDARARRELNRAQLNATPATIAGERSGGGGSGGAVADAERSLRELRLRYTDQHPDVVAARRALAEARSSSGGGGGGGVVTSAARPNPAHEALQLRQIDTESEIVSLERQIRDETAQVERLDQLARGAPQLQAQFQNLDRDYNVVRKQYEELLARRESLQIAGAARVGADQVRIEVVEPPTVPTLPYGPNRLLLAVGVLVAGLGAGGLLAVVFALLDQGFYTVQDLRRVDLPVLGAISALAQPRQTRAILAFGAGFALLILVFGAVVAGGPILAAHAPALLARVLA